MRRATTVLFACLLLAAGCSLGPREEWAEAMRSALEKAGSMGTARVRQSVKVVVIETTVRQQPQPLIARSDGVADFANRRAQLFDASKRKTELIYEDLVVYGRRSRGSIGRSGKDWARFDFEREPSVDIDDNDRRFSVGAGVISPVLALEVLDGVLTGSVERRGGGMKAGARTTRYTARLAPDAAITEVEDEDRKEGIGRLFATLGVQQDDFPVDVWIDGDGLVRGVRYVMRQQKDRVNAFVLTLSWEFSDHGRSTKPVRIPGDAMTLRSDRFSDFVTELIRDFG